MSKLKVLLTNAPCYGENWHLIRAGSRWPFIFNTPKPPEDAVGGYNTFPFFMAYTATYLGDIQNVGDVWFYDALARKHTYETFYKKVSEYKPDITIIETSTPSINNDLEVAKNIKDGGSEIALCGPHATVFADDLVKLPYVDYILQGEYEVNSFEMCLMRKKGVYKSRPLKNLDNIFPFRDNGIYNYADGFGQDAHIKSPQLQVWTSRGCPFRCRFCLWNETMTYGNYRKIHINSVTKEITHYMRMGAFESVLLDDDTVNVGDERTIEISKSMGMLDIQWHAMVRADGCSWDAFTEMKRNGCVGLKIGIESFSQKGLDYLKKGYNAEEIRETIEFLADSGFKIFLSLMTDIPTETDEDKEITKKWVEHFMKMGCSFQQPTCMPLPGTSLYRELDGQNKVDKSDWQKFGLYHNEILKSGN